jgi:hypothetical protein
MKITRTWRFIQSFAPPKHGKLLKGNDDQSLFFFWFIFSNKPSEKLVQSVQLEWYIPHKGPGTHPSAEIFKPTDFFDFVPGSIQPFFVETTLPKININPAIYWLEDYFHSRVYFQGPTVYLVQGNDFWR